MDEQIKQKILEIITQIPGISALASKEIEGDAKALNRHELSRSMAIVETDKGLDISIYIIISRGIKASLVANEIRSAMNNYANSKKIKVKNVSVFVRGVK